MSVNNTLQLVKESGWRSGFTNFLRKENGTWWRTRKWWVQSLVWFFILNGLVVLFLWVIPLDDPTGAPTTREAYEMFFQLLPIAALGVLILMQGVIVYEKQSGTAAWIMSNPISRAAFILAKLVAHTLAIFAIILLLQSALAYGQFALKEGELMPILPFLAGLGISALHLLFYITLSLMLGTLFNGRGPVIAIPIAFLILQDVLLELSMAYFPWLAPFLPTNLVNLATVAAFGRSLPTVIPILATAGYTVLFTLLAILRFSREEF
jgi:ABC-2 type transport system permease protein